MTLAAEKELAHLGESCGCADHDHDLIHELSRRLDSLWRCINHVGFPHAGYGLLGINNRDLESMKTDLGHALRIADMVEAPTRRVMVAESGIRTAGDMRRLRAHGIHIALVGEHLMRQPDPGLALKELLS